MKRKKKEKMQTKKFNNLLFKNERNKKNRSQEFLKENELEQNEFRKQVDSEVFKSGEIRKFSCEKIIQKAVPRIKSLKENKIFEIECNNFKTNSKNDNEFEKR